LDGYRAPILQATHILLGHLVAGQVVLPGCIPAIQWIASAECPWPDDLTRLDQLGSREDVLGPHRVIEVARDTVCQVDRALIVATRTHAAVLPEVMRVHVYEARDDRLPPGIYHALHAGGIALPDAGYAASVDHDRAVLDDLAIVQRDYPRACQRHR